jgi:DnaJ-class molecular chaperone
MKLDETCLECEGNGYLPYEYNQKIGKKVKLIKTTITCSECCGRGKVLTDFGKDILRLVREYSDYIMEY